MKWEEIRKNKRLTDYPETKDAVIYNKVKTILNKKQDNSTQYMIGGL